MSALFPQWRAQEFGQEAFGPATESSLFAARTSGPLRGLLRMHVPFTDLDLHREREARFLAAAAQDPILTRIPLVYVLGPATD
jgi:hypothetical protein